MKTPTKKWAETDVTSRWGRKYLAYTDLPGVRRYWKRNIRKRERRLGHVEERDGRHIDSTDKD